MSDADTMTAIQSPRLASPHLEVRECGAKGKGVFATAPIAKGSLIATVSGFPLKTADITDDLMAMQVGDEDWLCSHGEFLDDYINHSCAPNAGFAQGTPVFYALRDIQPEEEVCFHYSTSVSLQGWSLHCLCGDKNCHGTILPLKDMPAQIQQQLLPFAMNYIRQQEIFSISISKIT